jgi:hypothetical protein
MELPRSVSLLAMAGLLLAGCNVSHDKTGNADNVQMRTPFGDMHIKTGDAAKAAGDMGLNVYPGAVPARDEDSDHHDSANINLNFGDFHLGVKAAGFQTSDSADRVEAFYRKDLARYGDVLECRGRQAVGQPTRTAQGLTCSDDHDRREIHIGDRDKIELRAGSPSHFHLVEIDPKNGGTHFGLVLLDVPSHHDSTDSE